MHLLGNYMNTNLRAVSPETPVAKAVSLMVRHSIGSLLVGYGKKVTGIFTERDLLSYLGSHPSLPDLSGVTVSSLMSKNLKTAEWNTPFVKALGIMQKYHIRHMPVTKKGAIIGVVSLRDLCRRYEEHLEYRIEEKEKEIHEKMAAIKNSEERFRSVFHNSAVGITLVNKDERIVAWNPFAARMLGMHEEELRGRLVRELYPKREWKNIRAHEIRHHGIQPHFETKIIGKNKKTVDVDVSISVLKDADGAIAGSIGIMRDISERKQKEREKEMLLKRLKATQAELVQAHKIATLGKFSVGIAHEIKNPLAVIVQALHMLNRALPKDDARHTRYMDMMRKATGRINSVITELLHLSRTSRLEGDVLSLHEVLDNAITVIKNRTKLHGITIRRKFTPHPKRVWGDAILLETVFLNLLTNAVDAMPDGGYITITSRFAKGSGRRHRERMLITVKDSGTGIAKKHIPHLFTPFFTTKKTGKGTGLGLSMVYLILEQHRSSIEVKSRRHRGTSFTLSFPVTRKKKGSRPPRRSLKPVSF